MNSDYRYYIYLHKYGISGKPFIINKTNNKDIMEMVLISDIDFNFFGEVDGTYLFKIYQVPFKGSTYETTSYLMENRKKLKSFLKFALIVSDISETNGYIKACYDKPFNYSVTLRVHKDEERIYYLSNPSIEINKDKLN